MTTVIVKDQNGNLLAPTHPSRARMLVQRKRAEVVCAKPFTIKLVNNAPAKDERTTSVYAEKTV